MKQYIVPTFFIAYQGPWCPSHPHAGCPDMARPHDFGQIPALQGPVPKSPPHNGAPGAWCMPTRPVISFNGLNLHFSRFGSGGAAACWRAIAAVRAESQTPVLNVNAQLLHLQNRAYASVSQQIGLSVLSCRAELGVQRSCAHMIGPPGAALVNGQQTKTDW